MKGQFFPKITVENVMRLALPAGTQVIAGETGLGREVTWAVAQRSGLPAFPNLKGGEMAFVSLDASHQIHDTLPFAQLVRQLADRGVAAIVVVGDAPTGVEKLANTLSVPILVTPTRTSLRELESLVARTITERRDDVYKWEMELHRRFTRISVEGEGVPAIVAALAEITGLPAAFEDESFALQFSSVGPDGEDVAWPTDIDPTLVEWARSLGAAAPESPMKRFALSGSDVSRLVAPILVRKRLVGYLSLLGGPDSLDDARRLALARAASACAMEMARTLAVIEVENRYRGEFIDSLVEGSFHSQEEMASRAKSVGYNPSQTYVVAVARPDSAKAPRLAFGPEEPPVIDRTGLFSVRLQEEVSRLNSGYLTHSRDDLAIILCPVNGEETGLAMVQSALENVRAQVEHRLRGTTVSVGIGRYHAGYRGIATSFKEAKEALTVAQDLLGGQQVTSFGHLGIYRLLLLLKDAPELTEFYQETLGTLIDYDQKNRSDLLSTLEAYFACHGNVETAAQTLYLHRNTLSYRLRRIEQLTGLDLKNMEDSFRLQLALKARTVTQSMPGQD